MGNAGSCVQPGRIKESTGSLRSSVIKEPLELCDSSTAGVGGTVGPYSEECVELAFLDTVQRSHGAGFSWPLWSEFKFRYFGEISLSQEPQNLSGPWIGTYMFSSIFQAP